MSEAVANLRRPSRLPVVAAAFGALGWAAVFVLIRFAELEPTTPNSAWPRVAFYVAVAYALLASFLPLELSLELPGLTLRGLLGGGLLAYVLLFVPAPRGWLLDLPEVPTYTLFAIALYAASAALAEPLVAVIGRRLFRQRARQFDRRRIHRQARLVGICFAGMALLAALRVLDLVSITLLAVALILVEILFLSLVRVQADEP